MGDVFIAKLMSDDVLVESELTMSTPPAKKTKWQEVIRFTVKWEGASDVEGLGGVLMLMRE